MADYTKATGSGGVMMIRVNASTVEFWIYTSSSSTWGEGFGWNGHVNGTNVSGTFNYDTGSPWVRVAVFTVTTNQTVRFSISDTGTIGLGGPTDFSVTVQRATVPAAPTPLGLDQIKLTSMRYRFSGNSHGGSAILEWQIGYGTSASSVQYTMASGGTSVVGGLSMGVTWYFWSRGRNAVGWGPWSARSSARTLAGCRVKVGGVWREAVAMVKVNGAWRNAIPMVKHNNVWKTTI